MGAWGQPVRPFAGRRGVIARDWYCFSPRGSISHAPLPPCPLARSSLTREFLDMRSSNDAKETSRYRDRRSARRENYPFARWIHRFTIALIVIAAIIALALWILLRMVSG